MPAIEDTQIGVETLVGKTVASVEIVAREWRTRTSSRTSHYVVIRFTDGSRLYADDPSCYGEEQHGHGHPSAA